MSYCNLRRSGEFCDITVQVKGEDLHLHRFPLLAHCEYFRGLQRSGMSDTSVVKLDALPGGYDTMSLIADFCYGVSIEDKLTTKNIGHVTCASSYLQMSGSDNLSEICQSMLRKLTTTSSKCLEVLVNCVDIGEVAQAEGVTKFCAETAVGYWSKIKASKWCSQLEKAPEWLLQLKKLPVNWTALIIDLLLTRNCSRSLITYFAAGYIDYIMECFFESHHSNDTSDSMYPPDATCETLPMEKSLDHVEIASSSCLSEASDGVAASASSSGEKNLSDTDRGEAAALSPTSTIDVHFPNCHLLIDTEGRLLKNYFEVFLSYIPDYALMLGIPTVTASWLSSVLQFSSAHVSQSEERLTGLCANSYTQLNSKDVIDFTSRVMANLNNRVHAIETNSVKGRASSAKCCFSVSSDKVRNLSNYYLNYHAEQGTISAVQFKEVLQSSLWCLRSSFDSPFEALEKLLQFDESRNNMISQENLMKIIENIDFTKLSQDALERASKNNHIPSKVTMEAAVVVCSKLRYKLREHDTKLVAMEEQLNEKKRKISASQQQAIDYQLEQIRLQNQLHEECSKNKAELAGMKQQLSEKIKKISLSQTQIEGYQLKLARLESQLTETQAKVKELELFPRLTGTWTTTDPSERIQHGGEYLGFRCDRSTDSSSTLSLCITQTDGCKKNGITTCTITAESSRYTHGSGGQPQTQHFNLRPAYIMPLTGDRSHRAEVSSKQMWETWFQKKESIDRRVIIPTFLIYDLKDNVLFSPSYSRRKELLQWTKS